MNACKAITAVAMIFAWLGASLTLRATPQELAPVVAAYRDIRPARFRETKVAVSNPGWAI